MSGVWTRNYSNFLAGYFGGASSAPATNSASYANDNISVKNKNGGLAYCGNGGGANSSGLISLPYLQGVTYH